MHTQTCNWEIVFQRLPLLTRRRHESAGVVVKFFAFLWGWGDIPISPGI